MSYDQVLQKGKRGSNHMKYTITYNLDKMSDQKSVRITDREDKHIFIIFASSDDSWLSLREKAHGRLRRLNEQIPPSEEIEI